MKHLLFPICRRNFTRRWELSPEVETAALKLFDDIYVEIIDAEKSVVKKIYEVFRSTHSIQTTTKIISKNHRTKQGAEFNASTTRLILTNPIYCVADERAYNYLAEYLDILKNYETHRK